jgi:molybdopterin/thiamine biosynthesis adenylyltransferase
MPSTPPSHRYAKNIVLPEIGEEGQARLLATRMLVVGAGGLGSPVLLYLAAAGVGRIGIVDPDRVELSNLQRQILFETGDLSHFKTLSARARLEELNPEIALEVYTEALTAENATRLCAGVDLVLDCCDRFETRYAINDACMGLGIPWASGALRGFTGQVALYAPHLDAALPCYRCFCPEPPDEPNRCSDDGVLGAFAGMVGSLQAMEALRYVLSIGEPAAGTMLRVDGKTLTSKRVKVRRDAGCGHGVA